MNNIAKMIQSDYKFNSSDFQLLQKTIEEYPWFALAHQLLTKAAFQLDQENFNQYLNKAALLAFNREMLFDYLIAQPKSTITAIPKAAEETTSSPKNEIVSEVKPVTHEATLLKTESETSSKLQNEPDNKATIESQTTVKIEATTETLDQEAKSKKVVEEAIVQSKTTLNPIKNADGKEIETKEELRDMVRRELERIDKERAEAKIAKQKEIEQKAHLSPEELAEKEQKSTTIILENFIKKSPSISPPADGPHEETLRLAKESLEEHYDFVSETLAEIYNKQESPEKAIKIYEQLILKLPEKKLYFAARIKEIVENK